MIFLLLVSIFPQIFESLIYKFIKFVIQFNYFFNLIRYPIIALVQV